MTQVKFPTREELARAYRAMHSKEIERKLGAGGLTGLAQEVAEEELARRQTEIWMEPPDPDDPWSRAALTRFLGRLRDKAFWAVFLAACLCVVGYILLRWSTLTWHDIDHLIGLLGVVFVILLAIFYQDPESVRAVGLMLAALAMLFLVALAGGLWGLAHWAGG